MSETEITIPACSVCGARPYNVTWQDLRDADGFCCCDNCDFPARPSEKERNVAALEAAAESMVATFIAMKPSDFFYALAKNRTEIIDKWNEEYQQAVKIWRLRLEHEK